MANPDTTVPYWKGQPISPGWWWLQFSDMPGPRYWDGTFWTQGSYFAGAEDYAEFPILGPCIPPTDALYNLEALAVQVLEHERLGDRPTTPEEFLGSPFFIAFAVEAFKQGIQKAVAEDKTRENRVPKLQNVDLDVIRNAYGWTIDRDGQVCGLTAGDQGYEGTGIYIPLDHLLTVKDNK